MNGAGLQKRKAGRGGRVVILGLCLAVGLAAFGIWSRESALADLTVRADDASIPRVEIISPKSAPPLRELTLPGNIHAWYEAPIYAQVAGYVKMWFKDYGATVKAGELLAVIDSPTIDAQFQAARANLAVAQARDRLAEVTAKRWQALAGTQAVSQQDVDQQTANATVQKALVEAAQQDVARYQALVSFKNVVSPFDGVVTSRLTDVGDYVNAAGGDVGSKGAASELFSVADIHELRVFVSIPQDYADILKPGLTATLSLPQAPGKLYTAQFLTSANAINPQTRTVVTELTIKNLNHELWPGTYVSVHFSVPADPHILIVPEQALLFRAQGMQVALLDGQGRVHLQAVTLGRNLGTAVQILSGIKKTDRIVNNPSMGLLEGETVKVVEPVHGYSAASAQPAPEPVPEEGVRR
ncbi:efflux RND transporter periplasmic adaptor subunit [Lichenicola cladoniae]|uniref:efflux RND transporter periplasmic adaptor subunit n=1 Tax=Lichenicola cladoniae TaxID=1484109 RepID=UPI001EF680DD|nr:efflux RND transporter periplasmic adaptor subunit [Lichenicola cladoniae]